MKARVKFSKEGNLRWVGHLDLMRYFQRAIRRAELPVAYSEGFSPHQILSFAAPLGVGLESVGEYFDMKLTDDGAASQNLTSDLALERLNREMAEGIRIRSFLKIPDDAKNCMAIVHAADFLVSFRGTEQLSSEERDLLRSASGRLLSAGEIPAIRTGKSGKEREIDLRPMIFSLKDTENGLSMRIAQGSAANLKPALLLSKLFETEEGRILAGRRVRILRTELYDASMRPLESYGEKF